MLSTSLGLRSSSFRPRDLNKIHFLSAKQNPGHLAFVASNGYARGNRHRARRPNSGEAAACPKHCKDAYITTNHTILVTAAGSPQDRFPATGRFNPIWLLVLVLVLIRTASTDLLLLSTTKYY
eukprot:COSAG02_NODE_8078_length_2719_cov_39.390076_1_plen_123_part_00